MQCSALYSTGSIWIPLTHLLTGMISCTQLGFFNIVGTPLFRAMVDLFEDAKPMLDGVLANYQQWEQMGDAPR